MTGLYTYIEYNDDTLPIQEILKLTDKVRPILWAWNGQYGWISKRLVRNLMRRQVDLVRQQKGYTRDKALDFMFY